MRYLGGKASTARAIAARVLEAAGGRNRYLEPFVGSGAVLEQVAPHFCTVQAGDAHPGIPLMWRALVEGWEPPTTVSEDRYRELRSAPEWLPERTLVGFGASFGGKFFAGYARPHARQRDPYGTSVRVARRRAAAFTHVEFRRTDYRTWSVDAGCVVYCDPPYTGGTGYRDVEPFDSNAFWHTVIGWARVGACVLVSEYAAPPWARCVLEMPRQSRVRRDDVDTVVDRLFMVAGDVT